MCKARPCELHPTTWARELIHILRETHQRGAIWLSTLDKRVCCITSWTYWSCYMATYFDYSAATTALQSTARHRTLFVIWAQPNAQLYTVAKFEIVDVSGWQISKVALRAVKDQSKVSASCILGRKILFNQFKDPNLESRIQVFHGCVIFRRVESWLGFFQRWRMA